MPSHAITGVLAAAGGLAAAELAAALTKPSSSPVIAIGESVIDATPTPVKEFAVKTVGTYDKPPKPFAKLAAGSTTIAGVAWAQRRGIAEVEIQVDDGPWQQATIIAAPSTDTWVQWRHTWAAGKGGHALRVRARTG
jgi:hypothetical protein